MGLVPPLATAPGKEHGAYASIPQQDEPLVSWILKQPVDKDRDLHAAVAAPYTMATSMLAKARAIGNPTSRASAAAFLQSWRKQGTPFAQDKGDAPPPASSRTRWSPSSSAAPQSALSAAWSLCDRYEQELDIIHIKYRWAMALLGKAYADKMDDIRSGKELDVSPQERKQGKNKVSSRAMDALLPRLALTLKSHEDRTRYKARLHRGIRWYKAAKQLGWGMLCLMPHDAVSNSWVENDLRVGHWHIWLHLLPKVNPDAYEASMALDAWLGSEGVSGSSISDKEQLMIELDAQPSRPQLEEVDDSEDSNSEDSNSDVDGHVEPAPSRTATKSPAPAGLMRQLTLLELCKPPT